MAVSMAMQMKAAQEQNAALDRQNAAVAEQAELENEELSRQRGVANEQAQAEKAQRVREADEEEARVTNAMYDMGGGGGANDTRLTAEVAAYEGIDLSRIEGNRVRQQESLRSSQRAGANRARSEIALNMSKKKQNTFGFLAGAANTVGGTIGKPSAGDTVKTTPKKNSFERLNSRTFGPNS
jgi:hypothetical protein